MGSSVAVAKAVSRILSLRPYDSLGGEKQSIAESLILPWAYISHWIDEPTVANVIGRQQEVAEYLNKKNKG